MIEDTRVYKNNCFKGLVNDHIFQIIKVGRETKYNNKNKTVYVTVRDLNTGNISQTNYDTFIRLQLEECEHPNAI